MKNWERETDLDIEIKDKRDIVEKWETKREGKLFIKEIRDTETERYKKRRNANYKRNTGYRNRKIQKEKEC